MKKYFSVILGSILIGLSYVVFFLPNNLISSSGFGLSQLMYYNFNVHPSITLLIINLTMIIIATLTLGFDTCKRYILTGLLIPVIIFLGMKYNYIVDLSGVEPIILVICGSYLTGYGYSLIHKYGSNVGGFSLIDLIINSYRKNKNKEFTYIIEVIVIILTFLTINFESSIYAIITIFLINYMSTKSKIGISNSKTFFVITTKEKEVKDYLLNTLNVDYTEFNVKGGYSNNKNKIIMTVIDTKDYYRLKEGINIIDSNAFIFILDNYETINQNVTISKKMKEDQI